MFLASHTRPDISFSLNLLARYSSCPTRRHWNGVKQIFRYLQGYFSDPHTGRSQTGYLFTYGGTAISWPSVKQTITATSSNHAEIIAIYDASQECFWLRREIQYIRGSCGISSKEEGPTVLHKDNTACIAQLKNGYIKGDRTKHILPKFFFTHDLQKSGDVIVQQVRSSDNLADLFTKSLPTSTFKKLVHGIGMRRLKELN
ncbi:secreted RxLR effector protein 161-like [Bidens hawaiensis]|uniref:secreted RxLR effector protein 161-like n=1 Tax=Bidens hawaiensis TaxID=980011 RepID=UPI00404A02ED